MKYEIWRNQEWFCFYTEDQQLIKQHHLEFEVLANYYKHGERFATIYKVPTSQESRMRYLAGYHDEEALALG